MVFLSNTQFGHSWLYFSPELWTAEESFQRGKYFVANIKVKDAAAKRGVRLQADYAANLTENEKQTKSLLQIVERHRQKFPDFRMSTPSFKH